MLLHTGFDFNAGNCSAVTGIYENKILHVFKEFTGVFDTPQLITDIKEAFELDNQFTAKHKVVAYPDASGKKRASVNASTSDIAELRKGGFIIKAKSTNPLVRDRIASVNKAFKTNRLYVDVDACPELTECLEQQVYLDNGSPDKSSGFDHLVDALGYMVYYLMPVKDNKIKKVTTVG